MSRKFSNDTVLSHPGCKESHAISKKKLQAPALRSAAYLDLNLVEGLSVVDTNNASDHLRDDDHVTEVGLHTRGLFLK
jgi:hypothetical protein